MPPPTYTQVQRHRLVMEFLTFYIKDYEKSNTPLKLQFQPTYWDTWVSTSFLLGVKISLDDVYVCSGIFLWLICCKLIQIICLFIKINCFLLKEHDENWWDSDVHNVIKFQFTQVTKHINKSVYLNILHHDEAVVHLSTESMLFEPRLFSKIHDSFLIKVVNKKRHCWPCFHF